MKRELIYTHVTLQLLIVLVLEEACDSKNGDTYCNLTSDAKRAARFIASGVFNKTQSKMIFVLSRRRFRFWIKVLCRQRCARESAKHIITRNWKWKDKLQSFKLSSCMSRNLALIKMTPLNYNVQNRIGTYIFATLGATSSLKTQAIN